MTIDLSKLPPVLPVAVSRVDKSGKPTKATIDWEQYYSEFVKVTANFANTTSIRTDTVQSDITTLSTTVGGNTASITTLTSSVGGIEVKYGVQGSINGVTGGFIFSGILKNDGSVAYDLEIVSNVSIHGDVTIDGTLTTSKVAANAITSIAANAGTINGTALSVSKSFFGGTDALVQVTIEPASGISPSGVQAYAITPRTWTIYLDGSPISSIRAYDRPVGSNLQSVRDAAGTGIVNVVGNMNWYPTGGEKTIIATGLSAGVHTFAVADSYGVPVDATITVTEFKR